MSTPWRHCFGEQQHLAHQWHTFGAGNYGVWRCDGSPLLVLRRGADGTWRDPQEIHGGTSC